jgi:hypothetical protein
MDPSMNGHLGRLDRALLALDQSPCDILCRAIVGLGITPVFLRTAGTRGDTWRLFLFFLLVLAAMRLVPALLRRLLPVSKEVKEVWAERRALAKLHDSYQWRKLLGIGAGWCVYLLVQGESWPGALILSIVCLVIGGIGLAFWLPRARALAAQQGRSEVPARTSPSP